MLPKEEKRLPRKVSNNSIISGKEIQRKLTNNYIRKIATLQNRILSRQRNPTF
jgi:hypothetical protein